MTAQDGGTYQATHNLLWPELRAWLIEHGLTSPEHVIEATIVIGNRDGGLGAWLDAEWYKIGTDGYPYMEAPNKDDAAKGRSSVPLRSWPPLHPGGEERQE